MEDILPAEAPNAKECKGMQRNAKKCKGMQRNAKECQITMNGKEIKNNTVDIFGNKKIFGSEKKLRII